VTADTPPYARATPDGVELAVWVVPSASRTEIAGLHGDAVRVRVSAPAEEGRANRAVSDLLRDAVGGARVELKRGSKSRRKVFAVSGVTPSQVGARLGL
jgi:uncharacterized protein (TIGR00251 family)